MKTPSILTQDLTVEVLSGAGYILGAESLRGVTVAQAVAAGRAIGAASVGRPAEIVVRRACPAVGVVARVVP